MVYRLIDAARACWSAVNAVHLVAQVGAGAIFHKGKVLERATDITPPEPTAAEAPAAGPAVARNRDPQVLKIPHVRLRLPRLHVDFVSVTH
jgi:hypothetical protein